MATHTIRGLTMDDTALDALIDAGTAMAGIAMKPHWREAVRMHLLVSLALAATVMAADLPDSLDPAPVFRA